MDHEGGLFLASVMLSLPRKVEVTKVKPSVVENGVGTACHVPRAGDAGPHALRAGFVFVFCTVVSIETSLLVPVFIVQSE